VMRPTPPSASPASSILLARVLVSAFPDRLHRGADSGFQIGGFDGSVQVYKRESATAHS
jgi:hypothetical protein